MRLPTLPAPPLPPLPKSLARTLPLILARSLNQVPLVLQRAALTTALQHIFRDAIDEGEFDFLHGHHIRIEIKDAGLSWSLSFEQQQLIINQQVPADACIRGNLNEFILLASRREDPDTLFFQRRLVIEGDTELGLEMKNVLDSLDPEALPAPLRKGVEIAADIVS